MARRNERQPIRVRYRKVTSYWPIAAPAKSILPALTRNSARPRFVDVVLVMFLRQEGKAEKGGLVSRTHWLRTVFSSVSNFPRFAVDSPLTAFATTASLDRRNGSFASFNNASRCVSYTRDHDRTAAPQHLTHWATSGYMRRNKQGRRGCAR